MELTAKTLQEVTFGAKVRGYDPAEVDDFIAAVAEGVEELHERLRRATERATRAEQQLATASVDVSPAVSQAEPASTGNTEISKVWERAVVAAEEAVNEAKAEAQRLLDEARNRADTQLNDARREAETTVSTARSEAARITEESQAQLKIEIQKLESARDSLNSDVSGLSSFLEGEKDRIKARLNEALNAIEQYGSGAAAPLAEPASSSYVSDVAPVTTTTDDWAAPTITATSATEPEWNGQAEWNTNTAAPAEEPSAVEAVVEETPQEEVSEEADVPFNWSEPQPDASVEDWQDETVVVEEIVEASTDDQVDDAEAEGDPFLAELRRAVQDDGPLGPREDETDDPLQDLYASDDDTNGFFRRNK
jgi:DivIVA domain-containing protein